jgi:hypothetical protein
MSSTVEGLVRMLGLLQPKVSLLPQAPTTVHKSSAAGAREAPVAAGSHRLIEKPMDLFMVIHRIFPTSYVH